ncbi:hypothetical protein B0H16DRAFT_55909 [Mycena metata]|uniref:Uncharacterized protein n=1 Tax=Mycena metata TaxID=1033252 RepID=A0AAD7IDJ0_9AGAR|nr:hypothetical protein B0H16DRAFT_55909 [Mycena metata]
MCKRIHTLLVAEQASTYELGDSDARGMRFQSEWRCTFFSPASTSMRAYMRTTCNSNRIRTDDVPSTHLRVLAISPTGCAYPQPFICACGALNAVAGRDGERDGVTLLGGEDLPRTKCETQEPFAERSASSAALLLPTVEGAELDIDTFARRDVPRRDLLQKLARPRRPPATLSESAQLIPPRPP